MHPSDWHSLVFAKHAQHVVLVHFPIALYVAGTLFDFLSRGRKDNPLAFAAYLNFTFAAVMTIPVIVSGVLAWQFALEGEALKGILLLHFVFALTSAASIGLVWWIHYRARRNGAPVLPRMRILPEFVAVLLIAITAHLGGFLSGVNL